jgi:2-oxoisovalerate dehydrogenase E2 component (dihydrolipoyl transacylase)
MTLRIVRLPDVGEGVAEAELVAWHVSVGDAVTSDSVVAEVLTDKATVEIYAPVAGIITSRHGKAGDVLAVGSDFIAIETDQPAGLSSAAPVGQISENGEVDPACETGEVAVSSSAIALDPVRTPAAVAAVGQDRGVGSAVGRVNERSQFGDAAAGGGDGRQITKPVTGTSSAHLHDEALDGRLDRASTGKARPPGTPVTASPAVRERARNLGVDLALLVGSGPDGRVTHDDLDRHVQNAVPTSVGNHQSRPTAADEPATTQIPLIGLRRKIAAQMTTSSSRIPHITYVEEVDMTRLEEVRRALATEHPDRQKLTILPFLMAAVVRTVATQPTLNATFDDKQQVLTTHRAVHIGIASQTPQGLLVAVVHDAESMGLWDLATELVRVSTAARNGTAQRRELMGSTITITSLGALGGLVTTPIINHPEVAIIGVNKMQTRPMWDGASFVPRKMMNLSSSFDHRIIDGWEAATFIQRIKTLLEEPALLVGDLRPPSSTDQPT